MIIGGHRPPPPLASPGLRDRLRPPAGYDEAVASRKVVIVTAPSPPPLDVVLMRSHGVVVVRLSGELDCATAPQFAEALQEALWDRPGTLIVDLTAVPFLDPAGARPLRSLVGTAELGTRVRLRGAAGTVRRVVELLGMADLLVD